MSEAKQTPGPWYAHHDHGWLVVESSDGDLYIKVEKGSAATRHLADARLIAAAPELLEALTYAIKQVPELGSVPGIAGAIAKATGGAK